jgi:hypothetical protein
VHVYSHGRPVRVVVGDQACVTPCTLVLPGGEHRARIDGLDRTLVAYESESDVYVTPTKRGRMVLGGTALVLGTLGLTFGGHWASPLEGRQRIVAVLSGTALVALAVPILTSSSARVEDWRARRAPDHRPSQLEVLAGAQLVRGSDRIFATAGLGFRPANRSLGVRAAGRFATDAGNVYQLLLGGTLYGPRLPIVQPSLTFATGLASYRPHAAELSPAELEVEAGRQDPRMRPLLELDAQLSVEVPWPVKPRAGVIAQVYADDGELALVGEVGLLTRM